MIADQLSNQSNHVIINEGLTTVTVFSYNNCHNCLLFCVGGPPATTCSMVK